MSSKYLLVLSTDQLITLCESKTSYISTVQRREVRKVVLDQGLFEMEEAKATAAVDAPSVHVSRIFVGGLSVSVTAADLVKTFSSLGRVCNVEFIRTNGRSFAYMDFQPNSDRDLAKLFGTVSFDIQNALPFPLLLSV